MGGYNSFYLQICHRYSEQPFDEHDYLIHREATAFKV